jgi:hypothetical protein
MVKKKDPKTKVTCAQNKLWNGLDLKIFEIDWIVILNQHLK